MWLIAGLGNPGSRYQNTPHNLGFEVVDFFCQRHGMTWQDARKFQSVVAAGSFESDKLIVMKPQTYMNLSGQAVRAVADYYKVEPQNILVISDDINLPYGKLRLREKGSHGGQNGLKNIIACLGTDQFPRLRVGCQPRRSGIDLVSYVLGNFGQTERIIANQAIDQAADAIELVMLGNAQKAMAETNGWVAPASVDD